MPSVWGRKVAESPAAPGAPATVSYAFGDGPDAVRGVVVIPVDDAASSYLEGRPGDPMIGRQAAAVAHKARRTFEATGAWPDAAHHFSC